MQAISKASAKIMDKLTEGMDTPGDHKSIENEPYTRLVIENIGNVFNVGKNGKGQLISMAHYPKVDVFEDALVDPEVCFIKCVMTTLNKRTLETIDEIQYFPYYIKYVTGMEYQYLRFEDNDFHNAKQYTYRRATQKDLASFVNIWCRNIKEQGFLEAKPTPERLPAIENTKEVKSIRALIGEDNIKMLVDAGLLKEENGGLVATIQGGC